MSESPPAYQYYARDFAASTAWWDPYEVGCYQRLLNAQWEAGELGLPEEVDRLRIVAGASEEPFQRAWSSVLSQKFPICEDGRRRNPRLERVRQQAISFREQRSKAGKASAAARQRDSNERCNERWNGDPNGDPNGGATLRSPSPSPDSCLQSPSPTEGAREDFETWYAAYPKKRGPRKARAKWVSLRRSGELPPIEDMLAKLAEQRKSHDWTKEDGRYVPNPATYLEQGRWDDEVSPPPRGDTHRRGHFPGADKLKPANPV